MLYRRCDLQAYSFEVINYEQRGPLKRNYGDGYCKSGLTGKVCYSVFRLFTGFLKAAFIVCKIISNAVIAVNRAIEKTKGDNDIFIL